MGSHHGIGAAGDRGAERGPLDLFKAGLVGGDSGEIQVGIGCSISMSGKMFGCGQNPCRRHRVRAFDERRNESRYVGGIFPVGADVDDGVIGVVVDVGIGKEEPLNAQGAGFLRGNLTFEPRLFGIP